MLHNGPRGIDCADWTATDDKFRKLVLTANFNISRSVKGGTTPAKEATRTMDFLRHEFQGDGGFQQSFKREGNVITIEAPGSYAVMNWLQSHTKPTSSKREENRDILKSIHKSLQTGKADPAPLPAEPAKPRLAPVNQIRQEIGMPPVPPEPEGIPIGTSGLMYYGKVIKPKAKEPVVTREHDDATPDFFRSQEEARKKNTPPDKGGRRH